MRKFENLKMVLFDSTKASFKLTVEAQFTRGNKEQGYRDLVYITDRYTGMLNPNIYLTLSYKDENVNPVYTSYPQLFRLREAFEKIKNLVADGSGFTNIEGQIAVRPDCQEPVVLANIGKNNNWISMKLSVIQTEENGILTSEPGVSIELSTANRYVSALSVDEFLTVYTIIHDLDLASIQCAMSLAFLDVEKQGYQQPQYQQQGYQQPQYPQYGGYQQPQYQQPTYAQQAPRNNYYQNNGGYSQPRYNNQPNQNNQQYGGRRAAATPAPVNQQQTVEENTTYMRPQPRQAAPVQQTNTLPARDANKQVMSLNAVESTEINEISYDDASGLDDIFNS